MIFSLDAENVSVNIQQPVLAEILGKTEVGGHFTAVEYAQLSPWTRIFLNREAFSKRLRNEARFPSSPPFTGGWGSRRCL